MLIDTDQRWPFAKEFFAGVPAPAAALVGGLPLLLWLQFGDGWWSAPITVGLWALLAGGLVVSRLPTMSFKTVRVPTHLVPLSLVVVGLGFAALVVAPFLLIAAVAVSYLLALPYTIYRFEWLKQHPEAWDRPIRERRAIARAARSARRLGLRSLLRSRVAGGARTVARAVLHPDDPPPPSSATTANPQDWVATTGRRHSRSDRRPPRLSGRPGPRAERRPDPRPQPQRAPIDPYPERGWCLLRPPSRPRHG